MLAPKAQYSLTDAKRYFKEHLSAGEYYSEGQQVLGRWYGKGVEALGLSGVTQSEQFLRLCENQHPQTGERLTLRQKTTRTEVGADGIEHEHANRRVFYDFTFSPPKSVSIAAFVGPDARVVEAHEQAVMTALEQLQSFAATRVRKQGQCTDRTTGNIVSIEQKRKRVNEEHIRILRFGGRWREVLIRLDIQPLIDTAQTKRDGDNTSYWVVSPNVRNNEATVGLWRRASVSARAAFMGWSPNDLRHGGIGPRFAGLARRGIKPGDVILIARRHVHKPEIVGFGVVLGKCVRHVSRLKTPESYGSLRRLRPFRPWSGQPPSDIPLIEAVRHTKALAQLHPESNNAHRKVCEWVNQHIRKSLSAERSQKETESQKAKHPVSPILQVVSSPESHQLDYKVQTKAKVFKAMKVEAALLEQYRRWLRNQDREIATIKYNTLQCDAFEEDRRNLIEAKSSSSREHIRMAVGQLLDYSFQGRKRFSSPHKAILLPDEPRSDIVDWLNTLGIKIIWRQQDAFLDNANGQFT